MLASERDAILQALKKVGIDTDSIMKLEPADEHLLSLRNELIKLKVLPQS